MKRARKREGRAERETIADCSSSHSHVNRSATRTSQLHRKFSLSLLDENKWTSELIGVVDWSAAQTGYGVRPYSCRQCQWPVVFETTGKYLRWLRPSTSGPDRQDLWDYFEFFENILAAAKSLFVLCFLPCHRSKRPVSVTWNVLINKKWHGAHAKANHKTDFPYPHVIEDSRAVAVDRTINVET